MNKLSGYIIILLSMLCAACVQPAPVPADSLIIGIGITNNTLTIGGAKGATATFNITSKLDWEILDTPGIVYTPASGAAGENIKITATATEANNSLQQRKLGDVVFRLSRTRFTGIEAYQEPQIVIAQEYAEQILLPSEQGKSLSISFNCNTDLVDIKSIGDIECTTPSSNIVSNKYSFKVSTTKDNLTMSTSSAGYICFMVDGIEQGKIEVKQEPAIIFDRSSILVNGNAQSTLEMKIGTPFNFSVSTSSSAFTVTKGSAQNITITTTQQNATPEQRNIGQLQITLVDNPACVASIDVIQRTAYSDKAILFYFLGTALNSFFESNLKMVEQLAANNILEQNNTRILVFKQTSKNSGTVFEVRYDQGLSKVIRETLKVFDLPTIYNTEMIQSIFTFMASQTPTKEHSIIFGAHGKGWLPKSDTRSRTLSTSSLASYEDLWIPAPGSIMVRHMGDNQYTRLDTHEIAAAIKGAGFKPEYIIFDVCYMANIESLYDLKECTNYILASPCEVIASGMPYNQIIPQLINSNATKTKLDTVAKLFIDYYNQTQTGIYKSACAAVIDCSEIDALAEATKKVNASLKEVDPDSIQYYDGINTSLNPTHIFFDIEDYAIKSCTDKAALDAFMAQMDKCISGQFHTDTYYSAYNNKANPINYYSGITTSAPIVLDSASAYIDEWKQTAWYKATH